jgi:phage terminase small subunit
MAEKRKRNESIKRTYKKFLFAQNYILRGMNATEALVAAGYSPKSQGEAWKFLRDQTVRRYIQALLQEQQEKLGEIYRADKENIINELVKIAFADPRRIVRVKDGKLQVMDSDEITNIEAAAIAEVSETKRGLRIKFHSKVEALDRLAKILGLYIEKHEHTGKDGSPLNIILSHLNPEVFGGGNSSDA